MPSCGCLIANRVVVKPLVFVCAPGACVPQPSGVDGVWSHFRWGKLYEPGIVMGKRPRGSGLPGSYNFFTALFKFGDITPMDYSASVKTQLSAIVSVFREPRISSLYSSQ